MVPAILQVRVYANDLAIPRTWRMKNSNSLLPELLQLFPELRAQVYFKATLTAISHAMEDLVLASTEQPLVIANFQQERYYCQESARYQRIAQRTDRV